MQRTLKWILALAIAFIIALYSTNILLGNLNLDEGWYLYAAKSFTLGEMPYRDYFFTQGPMLPVIYGTLSSLWAENGILGGRILTAILGLLGVVLLSFLVINALPKEKKLHGAILTVLLSGGNLYHNYFTMLPKTYALATIFIVSAFLVLGDPERHNRDKYHRSSFALRAALCGLLLAFAAATRVSLGIILASTGFFLLFNCKRTSFAFIWFGIGGVIGLLLSFGPFVINSFEQFLFSNFFHSSRASGGLVFALGSISRLLRVYMPLFLIFVYLGATIICHSRSAVKDIRISLYLAAFFSALLIHLLSPFPYDDYNVPIIPLLMVSIVIFLYKGSKLDANKELALTVSAFLVAIAFAGSSTINEEWFVLRKDRFWVEIKQKPSLLLLREIGAELKAVTPSNATLLTQDTYLAIETDRRLPKGMELGPFGYFPSLTTKDARKYNVMNRELLEETIRSGASPYATISGYSFSMAAPSMEKTDDERDELLSILKDNYQEVKTIPNFGQEHTTLSILKHR